MKLALNIAPICLTLFATAIAWGQASVDPDAALREEAVQVFPEDAAAQTPSQPVPASLFGNTLMSPSHWPTAIGALGKGSGVVWPYTEPQRGVYEWSRMDAYVNAASAHGIGVMFANNGAPPWAVSSQSTCHAASYGTICSGSVANIQDWKNFVTALVTRYKGRIQAYELWNEPQNGFSGTVAEMVSLTNAEHDIIRSIDPAATILSPSAISYGSQYLDNYFASGGTKDIDGVAIHAYPNTNNDIAEVIVASMTSSVRSVMSKYGLSSKALWDTESSWGYVSKGAITNPDSRAAFVARSYLLHWSMGITRFYWYSWDNSDIGTLWSSSGVSEAGIAYQQIYNWINGATMSTCSSNGASSPYHAVYTCNMTRSGGIQAQAVWYTDGSKTYAAPSQYTKYLDLSGNTYTVPSSHQVTIGTKPILLEE